jgi:hypothetical protein
MNLVEAHERNRLGQVDCPSSIEVDPYYSGESEQAFKANCRDLAGQGGNRREPALQSELDDAEFSEDPFPGRGNPGSLIGRLIVQIHRGRIQDDEHSRASYFLELFVNL